MAVGPVQAAKRAFVRVLLALAVVYNVRLLITRDSSDTDVVKAYKKLSLKAHPDKGGKVEDQQALQEAKQAWEKAASDAVKAAKESHAARLIINHEKAGRSDAEVVVGRGHLLGANIDVIMSELKEAEILSSIGDDELLKLAVRSLRPSVVNTACEFADSEV